MNPTAAFVGQLFHIVAERLLLVYASLLLARQAPSSMNSLQDLLRDWELSGRSDPRSVAPGAKSRNH